MAIVKISAEITNMGTALRTTHTVRVAGREIRTVHGLLYALHAMKALLKLENLCCATPDEVDDGR